uniref:N-acetylgalactosaminide beta-1,3-galactosyltransferase n=1 Tax=Acrobeloides nanus TaxID=290746 RepID=A0A914E532_9BILA
MVGINDTRAFLVNQTWVHHCNKHIFITASPKSGLPTVDLNLTEGRKELWPKTKASFKWIYDNEINNYDWFLKADADSFIILENLRFMLLAYSRDDPVYFGCKFRPYTKQGYMSGGSGYVLSRKFVEEALPDPKKCQKEGKGPEDLEMGRCLENVGVMAGDSRDSTGKHRMLPFGPMTHFQAGPNNASWIPGWFLKYLYYPYKQGEECCSDYSISFHYVYQGGMLMLYDLIYHVRAFALTDDIASKLHKNASGGKSIFEAAKDLAISLSVPFESMVAESQHLISNSSITYGSN